MAEKDDDPIDRTGHDAADLFTQMLRIQGESAQAMMAAFAPPPAEGMRPVDAMGEAMQAFQANWLNLVNPSADAAAPLAADPASWMETMRQWAATMPMADPAGQAQLWAESAQLWQDVIAQYSGEGQGEPQLPRRDRRFADKAWRDQPVFALIHQTYLLFAERLGESVDTAQGLSDKERADLKFATRNVLDAMSPANFPLINPVVLERTIETGGENLVKGLERLTGDLERGQLTHTDTSAFVLGENVAATPGKVVFETELFQLIQYAPVTDEVFETPLLIFPPWINRFYILDLNPKKSFVRWAVEQGLTVMMVSWKSADESLAHIGWDDYFRAQMQAIDLVRERLGVPAVHTIGYCVAGTTLAGTLAVLARRGEADKVASATFFTAQVDFEHAGDLSRFIDDGQLELIRQASKGGTLDGRYLAATFNLLRGGDLIWNYVVNHYLLGEDYPAFDLLYWNGDVTNLPARWHGVYLRDLYRDNLLVRPDALSADGTPIDLSLVQTPTYIQAGREDHIAPAASVFRLLDHFGGDNRFVLAGSGHIAGVVNPPNAKKYQYWTNDGAFTTIEEFVAGAAEHPGSWWPDWIAWIAAQAPKKVKVRGKRKPGGKGDRVIEDAPGRYVRMR
ncbi:class I poly(R)-hydroxyalkanoic acid synthase [Erythrobacter arachoides]|uniref:Class I poly(R)-hydroxyalkanoic acid synthase n=1 Tax=Aurantiacibacter arachoides TaxID=1850444 RepID=A0A844ZZX5_9SPHN|nr:class I poly(R)-hydroxyalkanoic acid synthase [Aurantiacibacter arachoides]MXO92287.1 class I poly(R)-hydroxyalkanoic acid synthase [Aurantiacibacter arachoides]GGD58306.1 class I poly(R)-hydroxyalkanoic acid synthase [Aurantiacibacter arachoides]